MVTLTLHLLLLEGETFLRHVGTHVDADEALEFDVCKALRSYIDRCIVLSINSIDG
jgi:hypothetical protein